MEKGTPKVASKTKTWIHLKQFTKLEYDFPVSVVMVVLGI